LFVESRSLKTLEEQSTLESTGAYQKRVPGELPNYVLKESVGGRKETTDRGLEQERTRTKGVE
jgi:hypothetical protein